jgi:hypothetical protein
MSKINLLISRHPTQWFHRMHRDEMSPALSVQEFCNNLLEYLACKKLSLTISEKQFRHNMCEFLCTYYIAKKRNIDWRGPLTDASRPRAWTAKHEQEWQEYLSTEIFSMEFWNYFWDRMHECIWESRTPDWRIHIQNVILHYIVVKPDKLESPLAYGESDMDYESTEYDEEP